MAKIIVFQHRRSMRQDDVYTEEVEFDDDATEEEINEEFQSWVWETIIGDYVTWYEKEDE